MLKVGCFVLAFVRLGCSWFWFDWFWFCACGVLGVGIRHKFCDFGVLWLVLLIVLIGLWVWVFVFWVKLLARCFGGDSLVVLFMRLFACVIYWFLGFDAFVGLLWGDTGVIARLNAGFWGFWCACLFCGDFGYFGF